MTPPISTGSYVLLYHVGARQKSKGRPIFWQTLSGERRFDVSRPLQTIFRNCTCIFMQISNFDGAHWVDNSCTVKASYICICEKPSGKYHNCALHQNFKSARAFRVGLKGDENLELNSDLVSALHFTCTKKT